MKKDGKRIALIIIGILLLSIGLGCVGQDDEKKENGEDSKSLFKLILPDKTEKSFTLKDSENLKSMERNVSYQNRMGDYVGSGNYKAILIKDILTASSSSTIMKPGDTLKIFAKDGYSQEFCFYNVYPPDSWFQFQGDFGIAFTFDGETNPDWSDGPMSVFLPEDNEYSLDDCNATSAPGQGYFISQSAGARYIRNVAKIEIISNNIADWELQLSGKITETFTKTDFEIYEQYYISKYENSTGSEWTGVPLWRIIGRIDDIGPIRGEDAFNETLSTNGYDVKIVAGDDYSVSIPSSLIAKNDKIILSNNQDGKDLPNEKQPLWLLGEGLETSQMVFNVVEIEIID